MKINKVLQLPTIPCSANEIYLVKTNNEVVAYMSNNLGTELHRVLADTNEVTIKGPLTLVSNTTGSYTITNYDMFENYLLTPIIGVVNRTDEIIIYEPGNVVGTYGFYINNKLISIDIIT